MGSQCRPTAHVVLVVCGVDDARDTVHPQTAPPARATAVMAALLVLVVLTARPVAAQDASPVPEPALVVEGGATDGQVRLSPATQAVPGPRVTWLLANGGTGSLTFDLAIHDVAADDGDVQVGEPRPDLRLASDTLHLAPGEVGRIPLRVPASASPGAVALVARSVDAEPETTVSGLALVGSDGDVAPRVVASDASAGTFTVRLDSDAPALVDVAVQASAWPGVLHVEDVVEGVLVPAGGRDLDVALDGWVAGRIHVDVAVGGETPARASGDVWWWPAEVLLAVLAVLLLVAAVVTLWRHRRRR